MAGKTYVKQLKKEIKRLFSPPELPWLSEWKPLRPRRLRYERRLSMLEAAPLLAALLLFAVTTVAPISLTLKTVAYAFSALAAGFLTLITMLRTLRSRKLPNEDCLMLFSSLLAFLAGRPAAGALIVILCRAGQFAEAYLIGRAELGVSTLSSLLPEKAHVLEEFGELDVLPEKLKEGDVFLVRTGESVPTDGVILSGESVLDASAIGGLSEQQAAPGELALSGSVNLGEELRIRASVSFEDSALATQLLCLRRAKKEKTVLERRIEKFAAWYGPALFLIALFVGAVLPLASMNLEGFRWQPYLTAASLILLLASPSPLLLSVPLIFEGGMCSAFRGGLYVRDKAALEALYHVKAVAFGKTGTITDGRFQILGVEPVGVDAETLLETAAAAEAPFRHPIARAIKAAAAWDQERSAPAVGAEEIPGRGVMGYVDGKLVLVGNAALLEEYAIRVPTPERSGTAIHVAVGSRYWGYILVGDTVREAVFEAIEELRGAGVRTIRLLSGDAGSLLNAQLARALNFDYAGTELTPEKKLSAISFMRESMGAREAVAYVGDGFHDMELFQEADVGIALKPTGESAAEMAADLVLMDDDLLRVPAAMRLSVQVRRLIMENFAICTLSRAFTLLFGAFGLMSLSWAAFLTLLFTVIVMLNALRGFLIKERIHE